MSQYAAIPGTACATKHGYDPRREGALCDQCPLGPNGFLKGPEWAPVPAERHGSATLALARAPADQETRLGYPFAGEAGIEWTDALGSVGKKRTDVDIDMVIACQPPGDPAGAWERMDRTLKQTNDALAVAHADAGREGPPPQWVSPEVCCRPRLLHRVAQYANIIPLGGEAAQALLSTEQGIFALRGGPRELPTSTSGVLRRVLPTFNPGFTRRATKWREVLQADLGKAFRWFEGRRNWRDPITELRPSVERIREWLAVLPPYGFVTYDYETDSIEPLTATVRCLGLARLVPEYVITCEACHGRRNRERAWVPAQGWVTAPADERHLPCPHCAGVGTRSVDTEAILIPILSTDGATRFYTEGEETEIKRMLRLFFLDRRIWKVGHNIGSYDAQVSEQWLGVTPTPIVDTLFPTRMRSPDLPKNLGVVGGILTDVHNWKQDNEGKKIAYHAQSDWQLHYYCLLDASVNALIYGPLMQAAEQKGGLRPLPEALRPRSWPADRPWNLLNVDHVTQQMCVSFHKMGMLVDQGRRQYWEDKLDAEAAEWKAKAVAYATAIGVHGPVKSKRRGPEPFNPGSRDQLATVLFEKWGIVPESFTETGAPSVDDEVLRGIITGPDLPEERKEFLDAVRRYNRTVKAKSTFVVPTRFAHVDPEHGLAWRDGRVRASWNAHTTSVGRLSCSNNNQQNVPTRFRDLYVPAPGHVFIGGDVDQFHLRIIAQRWRIARLLEAFHGGLDPHCALAFDFFPKEFREAKGWGPEGFSLLTKYKPKKESDADRMRQVSKVIRYRGAYWDSPEGIRQSVIKTEDNDGNLIFAHYTDLQVRKLYDIWMRAEPEWEAAWQAVMERYHANGGWLESALLGRRSGSLEDGKKEAVVNFDILPVEADIMRLIEADVMAAFPFDYERGTGLVNQVHDSLEVETEGYQWVEAAGRTHQGPDVYWRPCGKNEILCWTREVEMKRGLLEECMTRRLPGWDVVITAEAKVGRNWKEA